MEINLAHTPPMYNSQAGAIGYSRYGVQLHKALEQIGVRVYDQPTPDTPGEITNTICWVSVPSHAQGWWGHQYTIMSTMWETQFLPAPFRDNVHHFDAIVVPCEQNLDLFSTYHDNVFKVPLGIDPDAWHYHPRPDNNEFVFLCGGSGPRKGVDLAVRAFKKVFGDWNGKGKEPRLLLKNPKGENAVNDVELFGPRIDMTSGRLTDQQEINLYTQANCYLQPSRGEGFGLQPLQAMALGCPTILTDASGLAEFAHVGVGIPGGSAPADYFIYGDSGDWWEPDFDLLCQTMEWVYGHQHIANSMAERGSQVVAKEFTWEVTARKFAQIFGNQMSYPRVEPSPWFVPKLKRHLVRVNRHITANVSGTAYRFDPGKDYHEVADIKRLLFEAGALEVSCLSAAPGDDLDIGLTAEQYEKIPDYSASMAFCPTCEQALNSQPTKADLIEAGLVTG